MSVHIVIQPVAGYSAEVIEPSPGVRQLIAGGDQAGVTVQVPARIGGLADTARFARSLAAAATEFAEWCESQNRNRSVDERPEEWGGITIRKSTDEEENWSWLFHTGCDSRSSSMRCFRRVRS